MNRVSGTSGKKYIKKPNMYVFSFPEEEKEKKKKKLPKCGENNILTDVRS